MLELKLNHVKPVKGAHGGHHPGNYPFTLSCCQDSATHLKASYSDLA